MPDRNDIFALKLKHEAGLHKSACAFLQSEDAADVCSQLWVDLITNPPQEDINPAWLLQEVNKRARSLRGQIIKASCTVFAYTEHPTNIPGEISDAQLQQICSCAPPTPNLRSAELRSVFQQLPAKEQDFLAAYYSHAMTKTPPLRLKAHRLRKKLRLILSQR